METKSLENIDHLLIVVSSVNPRGHTGSDGFHGIIGILVLASRNIVQVGGLIGDLVLWPGVSMFPLPIGLNPGERVLDGVSSLGSGELN